MLKNAGREKPTKQFGKGKYIICYGCRKKIYIEAYEAQENIVRIGHTRIYQCSCGEDILLD